MLDLLRQGSQSAGRIASAFPVSRPAISKHLRLLRRAHLIEERREGRHRFYHLNPEPLKAVDSWLDQYRVFWRGRVAYISGPLNPRVPHFSRLLREVGLFQSRQGKPKQKTSLEPLVSSISRRDYD